jgi:hypothetical protein
MAHLNPAGQVAGCSAIDIAPHGATMIKRGGKTVEITLAAWVDHVRGCESVKQRDGVQT